MCLSHVVLLSVFSSNKEPEILINLIIISIIFIESSVSQLKSKFDASIT